MMLGRHHRSGVSIAATLLAVVLVGACGNSSDQAGPTTSSSTPPSVSSTTSTTNASSTTSAPADPSSTTTEAATTSTSAAGGATTAFAVYLAHGDHLATAGRSVPATITPASAAVTGLLAGPTAAERASGLGTAIPDGTRLNGISISQGIATVDLSPAFASGGGSLSMQLRVAEVVFTVTQFATVQQVRFELDGQPVTALGGEGLLLDHPVGRSDYEAMLPAILVESPRWGTAVSSPLRVRGTADVFEAVFQVEVTDWDGRIVASKTVMASSGTGTRGTFDVTLTYRAARSGNGAVIVSSRSPKDGARINVEEIPLVVTAS